MELTHLIGKTGNPFTFKVEQRHIRQFAQAIGDSNPLYTDEEYAKKTPYKGIIAPLTFPIAVKPDDENDNFDLGLDYRRMLHGEQQFKYSRPIRAGETLYCHMKVTDVYEKDGKNGAMEFILLDTEINDVNGEHIVTSRTNILYRPLVTN